MKSSLIFLLLVSLAVPCGVAFADDNSAIQLCYYSPVRAKPLIGKAEGYSFPTDNSSPPPKRDSLWGTVTLGGGPIRLSFDQSVKTPLLFRGSQLSECYWDDSQVKEETFTKFTRKVKKLFKKIPVNERNR